MEFKKLLGKYLVLGIFLFFLITNSVIASKGYSAERLEEAPLSPEYLEYLERIESGESPYQTITYNGQEYTLGRIPVPYQIYKAPLINPINKLSLQHIEEQLLPNKYDAREHGRVTSIKDQGHYGTCWAFGGMSALEASFMPLEEHDFSENHLAWNTGREDINLNTGGYALFNWAYFLGWNGPVDEVDAPYTGERPTNSAIPVQKHVQNVKWVMHGADFTNSNNESLKRAIMKYGAVDSAVYISNNFNFLFNDFAYYSGEKVSEEKGEFTNHEITLVAWDDNFPKENFLRQPPGDGAFLVKNSWGKSFGDEGYFWISYHDIFDNLEENKKHQTMSSVYDGESTENFADIYQYDPFGYINAMGILGESSIYGANNFEAITDGAIEAVGLYAVTSPLEYKIYMTDGAIQDNTILNLATLGEPWQEGALNYAGYHTIELDNLFDINEGMTFSTIVEFTLPSGESYPYLLPVEYNLYDLSFATANPGESMMGTLTSGGIEWRDLQYTDDSANICIKAYSYNDIPPALESHYPMKNNNLMYQESEDAILSFNKRIFQGAAYENIKLLAGNQSLKSFEDALSSGITLRRTINIEDDQIFVNPSPDFQYGEYYTLCIPKNALMDKGGRLLDEDLMVVFSLPDEANYKLNQAMLKFKKPLLYSTDNPEKLNLLENCDSLDNNNISINWESKDIGLVDHAGNILKPLSDITSDDVIKLEATLMCQNVSLVKNFEISLYNNMHNYKANEIMKELDYDYIKGENSSSEAIYSDLKLINEMEHGGENYEIEWFSFDSDTINSDGQVNPYNEEVQVDLLARIIKTDHKKSFRFTVPAVEDNKAPEFISSQPAEGSINNGVAETISLYFDEPIYIDDARNIILQKDGEELADNRDIYLWTEGKALLGELIDLDIWETLDLDFDSFYTLKIPANSLKDRSGNQIKEAIELNFKTRKQIEIKDGTLDLLMNEENNHFEIDELSIAAAEDMILNVVITDDAVDSDIKFELDANQQAFLPHMNVTAPGAHFSIAGASIIKPASGSAWDGVFKLPKIKISPSLPVLGNISKIIEIGMNDISLELDQAARLCIPNQAGREVYYIQNGQAFPILHVMSEDSQAAGDALVAIGEGKINVGSDLVIWTKHFTEFVIYSPIPHSSANSSASLVEKDESEKEVIPNEFNIMKLSDIEGHWAQNSIKKMLIRGVVKGYPDKTFKPERTISRAEFVSLLVNVFSLKDTENNAFLDIRDHWAKDNIAAAYKAGIASGYDAKHFGPDDLITREAMMVMLLKAAKVSSIDKSVEYEDANEISPWAFNYFSAALDYKIITGYPNHLLKPKNKATRGEAVTVIIKVLQMMDPNPAQQEIKVKTETGFTFNENPTTGYTWHVVIENPAVLSVKSDQYTSLVNEGLKGLGGTHSWEIKGVQKGESRIVFQLYRDFGEKEIIEERIYTIKVI